MDRDSLIKALEAAKELLLRKSRTNFATFVRNMDDEYQMQWFHEEVCRKLDAFERGEIKKMMILMPPQHGKSELASRKFPAYCFGRNPNRKIALASYSQAVASGFNRSIQRNIENVKFAEIFPETRLNNSALFGTNYDNFTRTDKLVDIIGKDPDPRKSKGKLMTVGRDGPLTSESVDIGIIDDLYKNREEARSEAVSASAWSWYTDVFKTRLHNNSQQLLMNTRWDNLDLAGRLLESEPGEWEVITFTGIRTKDERPYDARTEGEALWEGRHSLARLIQIKKQSEITFNSLYQQDPKAPSNLLVYPEVFEIPELPPLEHVFWGLDFGHTNSKTVLTKGMEDPQGSYFDECCYHAGLPMSAVKDLLFANGYVYGQIVWCDHEPDSINELRLLGILAMPANKSVAAGIMKMQEKPIFITKRSVHGRREASNYTWVAHGNVITNIPEKNGWDHFWDSCRYGRYSDSMRRRGG